MTTEQLAQKITKIQADLTQGLSAEIALIVQNDFIGQVVTRIRESGKLYDGSKEDYSTTPTLVGYPSSNAQQNYKTMYRKAYETARKRSGAKWATVGGHRLVEVPGGYKEIRETGGLQGQFKDFTVSGIFLNSVRIKSKKFSGGNLTVIYGPTGNRNIKIGESHNERHGGNILLPTEAEINQAKKRITKIVIRLINKALNG